MVSEYILPNVGSCEEVFDVPAGTSASSVSSCAPFALALRRVEDTLTSSTITLQRETRLHQRIQDTVETLRYVLDGDVPEEITARQKKVAQDVSSSRGQRTKHSSRNETLLHHPLSVSSSADVGAVLGYTDQKRSPPSSVVTAYFDGLVREWCHQNAFTPKIGGEEEEEGRGEKSEEEEEEKEEMTVPFSLLPHSPDYAEKSMAACTTSPTISLQPLWLTMKFMGQNVSEHIQKNVIHRLDRCTQRVQHLTAQLHSIEEDYHQHFLIAACAAALEQSSLEAFIDRKANARCPFSHSSSMASSPPLHREEEEEEEVEKEKKEGPRDSCEMERTGHFSQEGSMGVTSMDPSAETDGLQEAYQTVLTHLLRLSPTIDGVSHLDFTGEKAMVCPEKDDLEEEGERDRMHRNPPPHACHPTDDVVSVLKEMQKNHSFVFPSPEVFFVRKISRVVLDHLPPAHSPDFLE